MGVVREAPAVARSTTVSARAWRLRRNLPLYVMLLPALIGLILFHYYPMYGIVIAFKNYKPLIGFGASPWVGFKWFRQMFSMPDVWEIVRNSVLIAVGKIVAGQVAAIVFALLLNEVRISWFKRLIQSLSYLLHFLSWMIFGLILLELLATYGLVNDIRRLLGLSRVAILSQTKTFPLTMVLTNVWKEFGWGSVIYLAALTGIDPTLYEVAAVDGANRWQRMRHITLPGLSSTIVLMSMLSLGGVLNAGFEQIFVLYNPIVYETGDIIGTFVYRVGLLSAQYSLATTIGLLKGMVGLILISVSYYLADRLADYRIF